MPDSKPKPEQVELLKEPGTFLAGDLVFFDHPWEEFYGSFLSPEYIMERNQQNKRDRKSKKAILFDID
jgi:hypothetical protein